eukprot:1189466-Rhodomonas_salina.2
MDLPFNLTGLVWPAERVVIGRRVCKRLRSVLSSHADIMAMVKRPSAKICDDHIEKDFTRTSESKQLKVALRWQGPIAGLMGAVRFCPMLVKLDLSSITVCIGESGAGELAEALRNRGCMSLAHLDLSNNRIGAAGAAKLAEVLGNYQML